MKWGNEGAEVNGSRKIMGERLRAGLTAADVRGDKDPSSTADDWGVRRGARGGHNHRT